MKLIIAALLSLAAFTSQAAAQIGLPWPGPGGVASAAPGAGPFVLKCHSFGNTSSSPTMGTADKDCTGANFFVCEIGRYTGSGSAGTPTDTSGNTYTQVGAEQVSASTTGVSLWYSFSAATSASLHWGLTAISVNFGTMSCAGFSDGSSSAQDATYTHAAANSPGSITPAGTNRLLVAGFVIADADTGTPTVDVSYTMLDAQAYFAGNYEGSGLAYQIQTSAAAANPTFSTTGGGTGASIQQAFR